MPGFQLSKQLRCAATIKPLVVIVIVMLKSLSGWCVSLCSDAVVEPADSLRALQGDDCPCSLHTTALRKVNVTTCLREDGFASGATLCAGCRLLGGSGRPRNVSIRGAPFGPSGSPGATRAQNLCGPQSSLWPCRFRDSRNIGKCRHVCCALPAYGSI